MFIKNRKEINVNVKILLFSPSSVISWSVWSLSRFEKAELFQNSISNKSRSERERDTFVGPLLRGYNM